MNIEEEIQQYSQQLATIGITDPDDLQDLSQLPMDKGWTEKQLKFLEAYFSGATLHQAAKSAGYKGKTKASLSSIGNQVLERLETRMDHRQIWRRMGLGEARLGLILVEFLQDKSKTVRLETLKLATKAMGMLRDQAPSGAGARIIIMGDDEEVQSPHEYFPEGSRPAGPAVRITK